MNQVNIYDLLTQLEEKIKNSKTATFNKSAVIIELRDVLGLINSIRTSLPDEILRAKEIIREEEGIKQKALDYENETKKYCEEAVIKAKQEARNLVEESVIVRNAKVEASNIMKKATDYCNAMNDSSKKFIDEELSKAEIYLTEILTKLRTSREEMSGGVITKKN